MLYFFGMANNDKLQSVIFFIFPLGVYFSVRHFRDRVNDGFLNFELRISEIDGGGLRNAIPRESKAIVLIDSKFQDRFIAEMSGVISVIKNELKTMEPGLNIEIKPVVKPETDLAAGLRWPARRLNRPTTKVVSGPKRNRERPRTKIGIPYKPQKR